MTTSLLSFAQRGHWGKANWRGNCSGHVYKALFEQYRPKTFVDNMVGSGTSVEVATEMGIEAYGLDLHSGFNSLRHSIRDAVGKEVDMCLSHSPYGNIIRYSKDVWGTAAHPDDLSEARDYEHFCEMLHTVLLNQREAVLPGALYGTIIGDVRQGGNYYSYQAEMIARMPKAELASVMIKAQHNCVSDSRKYANMKHPRIMHEYILLWSKPKTITSFLSDLSTMAKQASNRLSSVWRAVVKSALIALGGESKLDALYKRIEKDAPESMKSNKNWQAQIRKVLQTYSSDFAPVDRGHWRLA